MTVLGQLVKSLGFGAARSVGDGAGRAPGPAGAPASVTPRQTAQRPRSPASRASASVKTFLNATLTRAPSPQRAFEIVSRHGGRLLTGPGGSLESKQAQREYLALFSSGDLFVAEGHLKDPYVQELVALARRQGQAVTQIVMVGAPVIAEIYSSLALPATESGTTERATEAERDIERHLQRAVELGASDMHFSTMNGHVHVDFRIDGVLVAQDALSIDRGLRLMATTFHKLESGSESDANYDLSKRQSGRLTREKVAMPPSLLTARVQWTPLADNGRDMVIRLLHQDRVSSSITELGYMSEQIEALRQLSETPYGLIIFSGPVNSGKSTTVSCLLEEVHVQTKGGKRIQTIEDPPEYPIRGARASPLTNNSGGDSKSTQMVESIKSMLRSDTNVALIGELRDSDSIRMAIRCALTGQQVWTTTHANRADLILPRLRLEGASPTDLYDPATIIGLACQRLTRLLCPHCAVPLREAYDRGWVGERAWGQLSAAVGITDGMLSENPEGCPSCRGGFKGRTVVAEVIRPFDEFMALMAQDRPMQARQLWLEGGGVSMMMHALVKLAEGQTSVNEIVRILGPIVLERGTPAGWLDRALGRPADDGAGLLTGFAETDLAPPGGPFDGISV